MSPLDRELEQHVAALRATAAECAPTIERLIEAIVKCLKAGNKILLCGNGGSAADAQHVAGEFINRFRFDRDPLPAIALTTDTSVLTCIGNDSDFEFIFSKQVQALARADDIVVGITTSGRSRNIWRALEAARKRGAMTVGFTGIEGKAPLAPLCDLCLAVPTADTPRIQEAHEFVWHVICGTVEKALFPGHDSPKDST